MNADAVEQLRERLAAASRRRRWWRQRGATLLWATGLAAASILLTYTGPHWWSLAALSVAGEVAATALFCYAVLGP